MTFQPPTTGIPTLPPAGRTKRIWLGVGVITAATVTAFCCGLGIGASGDPETVTVSSPSPYPVTTIVTVEPSPAAAPASTTPAAPSKSPAPTIDDGIWTVGVDFPAGTYRVREPLTQSCYWSIYKSGTNGSDIIDNDIVNGGKPTVTLKKGHDFKTSDCGTWVKIK